MIFQQSLAGNSRSAKAQFQRVLEERRAYAANERMYGQQLRASGLSVNQGLIPQEVFQEFDNVTVERMRSDDGDTFLNDLLPLSRSINIGKLVHRFRQASDAGRPQSSITGQIGVKMDQVDFKNDGAIIPVHDAGFYRNWREWHAGNSEGFDALIDDQRETVACMREFLADNFLDGHKDTQGNFINVDGIEWQGMRNDTRVAQVSLVLDFTSNLNSGEQIKAAFISELRDVLFIDNKCEKEAVYYVSREIMSNLERRFSTQYDSKIISQELADLMGVAAIKVSSKLTDNEIMAFPLDTNSVRPVVGMGMNTVAMPRPVYNSNFEFVTWAAIGFQIRTDFFGNTCALFAQ